MREQSRPARGPRRGVSGVGADHPRPNRLSDEASPNVLHLAGDRPVRNAGPSWVRRRADFERRRRPARPAAAATATDGAREGQRNSPSLFTILVGGFVVIQILRACLQ